MFISVDIFTHFLDAYLCLQEYGADGLRTLALAYRELSENEWEAWSESHRCADKATDCREDRLAAAYDKIEQDMMVSQLLSPLCIKIPNFSRKRICINTFFCVCPAPRCHSY